MLLHRWKSRRTSKLYYTNLSVNPLFAKKILSVQTTTLRYFTTRNQVRITVRISRMRRFHCITCLRYCHISFSLHLIADFYHDHQKFSALDSMRLSCFATSLISLSSSLINGSNVSRQRVFSQAINEYPLTSNNCVFPMAIILRVT